VPMVCQDCPDRIAYTSSSSDRHTVLHTLWADKKRDLTISFSPKYPSTCSVNPDHEQHGIWKKV
jgi:hypothetical protein